MSEEREYPKEQFIAFAGNAPSGFDVFHSQKLAEVFCKASNAENPAREYTWSKYVSDTLESKLGRAREMGMRIMQFKHGKFTIIGPDKISPESKWTAPTLSEALDKALEKDKP